MFVACIQPSDPFIVSDMAEVLTSSAVCAVVNMKICKSLLCIILLSAAAFAVPLGGSARTVIPSDIQQIISVDYRALKNSDSAMAMKQQLLPPALKAFEEAL